MAKMNFRGLIRTYCKTWALPLFYKYQWSRSKVDTPFPKILPEPVPTDFNVGGKPFMKKYRDMPWIIEYWTQKYKETNLLKIPVRTLETDEMLMQNAAIREKKPQQ